jgi:hypothetical protein
MMKFLLALLLLCTPPLMAQTRRDVTLQGGQIVSIATLPEIPISGQYKPPHIYERWWIEISRCTGLPITKASREAVKFKYVMADGIMFPNVPMVFVGYAALWENVIYVTFDNVSNVKVVKHEMIHMLMWHNGLGAGHPPKFFKRCKVDV